MAGAIVLDIEGTVSSTSFVFDVLYPYAAERFSSWVMAHPDAPELAQVRAAAGDDLVGALEAWQDADVKAPPLKAVQGRIWEEGYAAGELTSHFYPDVIPALGRWHDAGWSLWVFSSGSVAAQRALFAHSPEGDLLPLISGHFDTVNAGPKSSPESYERIAVVIGARPIFLSDVTAELDAARTAGWRTIGVRRPGEKWFGAGVGDHAEVASFDEIRLR